jgi:hypothetical protein
MIELYEKGLCIWRGVFGVKSEGFVFMIRVISCSGVWLPFRAIPNQIDRALGALEI